MDTEKDYIEEKLILTGFSEQHIEEQSELIQATIDVTKRALSIANVSIPFEKIIKRLQDEKPKGWRDKINAIDYAKFIFENEC